MYVCVNILKSLLSEILIVDVTAKSEKFVFSPQITKETTENWKWKITNLSSREWGWDDWAQQSDAIGDQIEGSVSIIA